MVSLDPKPQVITFDCYGTLVNWHEAFLVEIGVILAEHKFHGTEALKFSTVSPPKAGA